MSSQTLEAKYKEYQAQYDEYKAQRIAYMTRMNDIIQRTITLEKAAWDAVDNLTDDALRVIEDKLPPREEVTIDTLLAHKEAWSACSDALEAYGLKLLKEI